MLTTSNSKWLLISVSVIYQSDLDKFNMQNSTVTKILSSSCSAILPAWHPIFFRSSISVAFKFLCLFLLSLKFWTFVSTVVRKTCSKNVVVYFVIASDEALPKWPQFQIPSKTQFMLIQILRNYKLVTRVVKYPTSSPLDFDGTLFSPPTKACSSPRKPCCMSPR